MISKKIVLGSIIFLAPAGLFAMTCANQQQDSSLAIQNNELGSQELQTRVIKSREMGMLNDVLALFPITTVRMKLAQQQTQVVQKRVQDRLNDQCRNMIDDEKFVQDQLKVVMEPIKQFFDLIRSYKDVAQPLIKECLQDQPYRINEQPELSLLNQFFERTGAVDVLASQDIKTIQALTTLCKDVEVLCGSVLESLSPRAKTAFEKTMQGLQDKKKQPAKAA